MTVEVDASARRFGVNVIWNMGSLAFLAAAGLVLNFAVGRVYGAEALGLFNIVFAVYILLSQLAVFGVHFSILRSVSEHFGRDQAEVDRSIAGGLIAVGLISATVTLLAWIATPVVTRLYRIDGIAVAWQVILPGLFCFSLNKFLLSAINGAQHMRAFAVLQALRFAFILAALWALMLANVEPAYLTAVFSLAEALLLPVLLWYTNRIVDKWDFAGGMTRLRAHVIFGAKVFASGSIGELNTRVDVLLVGAMLDSARAGVYSVALLLAEGLAQSIIVVRANLNPLITRHLAEGDAAGLERFGRKITAFFTIFMLVAGSGLVAAFALADSVLFPDRQFEQALGPLAILVAGLVLSSPYMPFSMTFTQAGQPALQTLFAAAVLAINIVGNAILIPIFGVTGAALGTALSYVAAAALLAGALKRRFGIRLWI
jgi:O-antigen/teichoic acid export membrane protein